MKKKINSTECRYIIVLINVPCLKKVELSNNVCVLRQFLVCKLCQRFVQWEKENLCSNTTAVLLSFFSAINYQHGQNFFRIPSMIIYFWKNEQICTSVIQYTEENINQKHNKERAWIANLKTYYWNEKYNLRGSTWTHQKKLID